MLILARYRYPGLLCFKTKVSVMSNSLALSLNWDSPASVTFPGYSSYPKPHLPERDRFFLPRAHHTLYASREQFLPLLGIIMKIPHFFQESVCPWGWRLYSSWRFKYWQRPGRKFKRWKRVGLSLWPSEESGRMRVHAASSADFIRCLVHVARFCFSHGKLKIWVLKGYKILAIN